MSILPKIAVTAALGMAVAISAPAQAATTFAGNGFVTVTGGNGAFADANIPAGAFADIIEFTVPMAGTSMANVIFFITGLTGVTADLNGTPLVFGSGPGGSVFGEITLPVSAGLQTLNVSGTSLGPQGSYSGTLNFTAIPEPATWLMMMTGFGLAGAALRRRKVSAPTVTYA